jgi:glycosyltransferase involved in cell wall biosynthesis
LRRDTAPRRIFIGLVEVAGFYGRLAQGFRGIGIDASLVDVSGNPHRYGRSTAPRVVRWVEASARSRQTLQGPRGLAARLVHRISLVVLFIWAAATHDTFIFSYRSTFLWYLDLPILRLLGKRIVYVFNGSDARPSYIDGAEIAAVGGSVQDLIASTQRKVIEIRRIERWANVIVAHPLYLHLFRRSVLGIQALGVPVPPTRAEEPATERVDDVLTVLHAPSDPSVKGTAAIRAAIEDVRAAGVPIRLVELSGVPNVEVQRALAACDFVIDQAYSDLPMSVFAVEAACHGKAAVVGSYGWADMQRARAAGYGAPVEESHPDRLAEATRRLVHDAPHRMALGARAAAFVEHWSPERVARRYVTALTTGPVETWVSNPRDCGYLHGVGMSEAAARSMVAAVLQHAGTAGLCLAHRPDLERAFVAFAQGGDPT